MMLVEGEGFEPSKAWSRQIYSLLPLAARAPLRTGATIRLQDAGPLTDRIGAGPIRRGRRVGDAELAKGLEPPTTSLQMRCSTS